MVILTILFLLSKTQSYIFLSSLYQKNTIQNYQNFSVKDLKDQLIGMNVKQKVRTNIGKMNIDAFFNQILLELIDYLF